jgi:hypothetical protein
MHSVAKILSKAMARRLAPKLDSSIAANQSKNNKNSNSYRYRNLDTQYFQTKNLYLLGKNKYTLIVNQDAFGTPEKQILIQPLFSEWIQSAPEFYLDLPMNIFSQWIHCKALTPCLARRALLEVSA